MSDIEQVVAVVRAEVAKYVQHSFADTDDFTSDLHILSDDLSFMASDLERRLEARPSSEEYRRCNNILELAEAFHKARLRNFARILRCRT